MREHTDHEHCWCDPYLFFTAEDGTEVWAHRDENGELPPPKVLVRAMMIAMGYDEDGDEEERD